MQHSIQHKQTKVMKKSYALANLLAVRLPSSWPSFAYVQNRSLPAPNELRPVLVKVNPSDSNQMNTEVTCGNLR